MCVSLFTTNNIVILNSLDPRAKKHERHCVNINHKNSNLFIWSSLSETDAEKHLSLTACIAYFLATVLCESPKPFVTYLWPLGGLSFQRQHNNKVRPHSYVTSSQCVVDQPQAQDEKSQTTVF